MKHFFPEIKWRLHSDAYQSQIIGGGADEDHTQIIGGIRSDYWGIYPPIPRVSAPLAASKVLSGCLFSTPIPLLLIETQLPQLKITLKHQPLSCFRRTLHLLQKSLNLSAIGSKLVTSRLKKKPS